MRVEPAADLRGASFELPGVQDGVTSSFAAAADGTTGTLTLAAGSALSDDDERMLDVRGTNGNGTGGWVGRLKVKTKPSASAKTFFVDIVTGKDSNAGTQDKPFKTLTKAISKVKSGDTIILGVGGYGQGLNGTGNGEVFPADGLLVPNGVTIEGAVDSGLPATTLLGNGSGAGLRFAGDAIVRNLFVGGNKGFGVRPVCQTRHTDDPQRRCGATKRQ